MLSSNSSPRCTSQSTVKRIHCHTAQIHNHGLLPNTCSQFRRLPTSKGFSDKVFDGSRFSMCSMVVILCSVRSESDKCVSMLTATNKVYRLTNVKAGKTRENNSAQQHERKNDTNLKRLAGHLTARVRRRHTRRLRAEGDYAPVLGSRHQTSLTPGQRAC